MRFLSLSLPFPVFSGATLASSVAHYLKSGKDPVIFSIHSVSDWMSALVVERRDGRKREQAGERKREGWRAGVWMGAGTVEKTRCRDKKKTRPRNRGKKGLCSNWCSEREVKPTDNSVTHSLSEPEKNLCHVDVKKKAVISPSNI